MKILYYLKAGWCKLGEFLHKVMSPVLLGIIYFLIITPFSVLYHLFFYRANKAERTRFENRDHLYTPEEMEKIG